MVFDSEPKGSAPPVSVRIPGEDETQFAPKVTPKGPAVPEQAVPGKTVEKTVDKAAEKAPEKAPEPVADKPAADAEKQRAEAALAGEQFIVPAGAYLDPAGVIEKLRAAKIPYYTEPIATKDGPVRACARGLSPAATAPRKW